ncbi:TPA: hypothetical protein I3776_000396 [Enterobacter cloacae]|uniref:hypothetical protein n=1 Tax=Enterobacter cloacae TaxID=550 RepID=UPI00349E536E|nr:hypothetical protein [Enterobacter cloacae]HAS1138401.1 hypothetical protein [Enterobacter cloacae]HAS1159967.1 hypothetical protein [Enterobacter cloacae]
MSKITKDQAKDLRNAFQCWQQDYDPVEDKEQYDMFGLGMVAMDALLASLEPVSVIKIDHESSLIKHVKRVVRETNAPPAQVSVPDEWRSILQEMVSAMLAYEMDVGESAPCKHRKMMMRAGHLLESHRAAMLDQEKSNG